MKNILILQESLNGGGAEKVLTELLNNIDYSRLNVTLLLINYSGIYIKQLNPKLNIIYIYSKKRPIIKRLLAHTPLINTIEKYEINSLLKNKRYDAIISFMEGITLKYHSYILDRAPLNITWVHSNLIINPWNSKSFKHQDIESNIYNSMNKIIFVSEKVKESFNKKYSVVKPEKKVLYNAINKNRIQILANEFSVKKEKFTICNVARLSPIKRQDRLIKAINILKERGCDIELWILGTGDIQKKLQDIISSLNLENRIKLLGFQNNPYPYIKAADIFVLSSDTEGYPTVICEALCLGKPIISTRITGCTELLGNNEYGILTDLNEKAIADAIFKLYSSKQELTYYQQKATEKANQFNIKDTITEFYNIIDNHVHI